MRPAFLSLKKICSRNSDETFSSVAIELIEIGLLWFAMARLMTARSPYLPFVVILIFFEAPLGIYYYQCRILSTRELPKMRFT